jgi:hypothetical protein
MMEVYKTSAEWEKELDLDVFLMDHEGWDNGSQFFYEKITRDEFIHRLAQSKIVAPRGLRFLWKDRKENGKR